MRPNRCVSAAIAVALLSLPQAQAQDVPADPPSAFIPSLPQTLAGVPGTWDLSRDGSTRRCVLTLSAASGETGRKLSFPAGCRRALPVLGGISGWLFTDDAVRLVDKDVRPILSFKRRADGRSYAAGLETGESYSLVPLQIAALGAAEAAPNASGSSFSGPGDPLARPADDRTGAASSTESLSGLYALDRFMDRDVCRVELQPGDAAKPAPVRILEGCRDSGIAVFDPVLWQAAGGRMTLKAKRGHAVELVPTGDGRWRRDPEVGTTFVLRRIEGGQP